MKFEDDSQNLRLRLRIIQVLVLLLLAVLGVRLYVLQVVNGSYYAERAENQQVRAGVPSSGHPLSSLCSNRCSNAR